LKLFHLNEIIVKFVIKCIPSTTKISVGLMLLVFISLISCKSKVDQKKSSTDIEKSSTPKVKIEASQPLTDTYKEAKKDYAENPNDPNTLIWFGRRTAYLGNYEDAIKIFTTGIQKYPRDPRMYRHRGHRYISLREYKKAIVDFENAVKLIAGKKDEIEPDGIPNNRNQPISTLHGNIWYHLGLAYYLENDMDNALRAFSNRAVTEKYDDNIVSGGHWLYMILSRLGKTEEANLVLERVNDKMDIIENFSYHKMCLFYKGLLAESDLEVGDPKSAASNVFSYGLGNWYLYEKQDTVKAKMHYDRLLKNGNKYSFAYLAAESDWETIFESK